MQEETFPNCCEILSLFVIAEHFRYDYNLNTTIQHLTEKLTKDNQVLYI